MSGGRCEEAPRPSSRGILLDPVKFSIASNWGQLHSSALIFNYRWVQCSSSCSEYFDDQQSLKD